MSQPGTKSSNRQPVALPLPSFTALLSAAANRTRPLGVDKENLPPCSRYELLTGSPPFTAKQLRRAAFTEMLRILREVEPPKPSTKLSSSEELPAIAAKRKLVLGWVFFA